MKEVYKDIPGYEGLYQVSNLGNVKSLNYRRKGQEELLSPGITQWGYLIVSLSKNGEIKQFSIHRLVAKTFLPNPLNLPEVNHKDHNEQNNCVDNLEWCTSRYNQEYSHAKQVEQYDLNGNLINVWKSVREIERQLGFSASHISNCCLGRYKQAYGYVWRYI